MNHSDATLVTTGVDSIEELYFVKNFIKSLVDEMKIAKKKAEESSYAKLSSISQNLAATTEGNGSSISMRITATTRRKQVANSQMITAARTPDFSGES